MPYNIGIWETIRDRVTWKVCKFPQDIAREIASDRSLQEFRGSDPVPWQLRQVMQQRAQAWIQRLYDFCCNAYQAMGKEPSTEFDMAVWAYCIEPFIMKEEVNENGYRATPLLELLLCAVGSPPETRALLRVSQKDCCLAVRNQVWETWRDKLHHLPSKWTDAAAAMSRYNAKEQQARRVVAGLPPPERKPIHSMIPMVPAEEAAKPAAGTDSSQSAEPTPAADQGQVLEPLSIGHVFEIVPPEQAAKSTAMGTDSGLAAKPILDAEQGQVPEQSGVGDLSEIMDEKPTVPVQLVAEGKWEDIEILFLSDERIQILRGGKRSGSLNYAEFGLEDGRTGNPNQAWVLLRRLAEKKGWIENEMEAQMEWSRVEKRIQEVRSILRKHFGITSNPIPFFEKTRPQDKGGYIARFKISCGPSYRA